MAIRQSAPKTNHPRRERLMTGAEMVIQVLADEGIDAIFGYSGGSYSAHLRRGIPLEPATTPIRRSTAASYPPTNRARGSWRRATPGSTGKVGVPRWYQSGPGATNTVTPVRDAMADSIPMIVICGQVPRKPPWVPMPSRRRRSSTS